MALRLVLLCGAVVASLAHYSLAEEPRRELPSEATLASMPEASGGSAAEERRPETHDQATGGEVGAIGDPQGPDQGSINDAALGAERQENWEECVTRPEVQGYLRRIKDRVLNRWVLSSDLKPDLSVTLLFVLDAEGAANRLEYVSAGDEALAASGIKAIRAAAPFGRMSDRVRCLAGTPVQTTFRNPAARFRGGAEVSYARGESVIDRMREAFGTPE